MAKRSSPLDDDRADQPQEQQQSSRRPRQNQIICKKCGGRMVAGTTKEYYTYYYCENRKHPDKPCDHSFPLQRPNLQQLMQQPLGPQIIPPHRK